MMRLRRGFMDGWFVLEGARGWASIEGVADDWTLVVDVLRGGGTRCYSKRCAARKVDGGFEFWSPRNSLPDDEAFVADADAAQLADQIEKTIEGGSE